MFQKIPRTRKITQRVFFLSLFGIRQFKFKYISNCFFFVESYFPLRFRPTNESRSRTTSGGLTKNYDSKISRSVINPFSLDPPPLHQFVFRSLSSDVPRVSDRTCAVSVRRPGKIDENSQVLSFCHVYR